MHAFLWLETSLELQAVVHTIMLGDWYEQCREVAHYQITKKLVMTIDNAVDIDMCIFALSLKFWVVTPKEAPLPISTLLRLTEGLRP